MTLAYSAVSNPADPVLGNPVLDGLKADASTYKTNFWDAVSNGAYDPFYPGALTPLAATAETGLPVPNVEELYLGTDGLKIGSTRAHGRQPVCARHPLSVNAPQPVQEYFLDKPFFAEFRLRLCRPQTSSGPRGRR